MSRSSPLRLGVGQAPPPQLLTEIDPKELKPHPRNSCIYGSDEDVTELVELIAQSGWVKPLVITPSGTIISGHRRWKAALQLELESVPVEVRELPNELAELEALLLENASRVKNIEQKVREASAWKELEASKAYHRQILLAGTRPNTQPDLQANLPEGEKGQTRERIARRVGLRARNYEKAAAVVKEIDLLFLNTPETAMAFRKVLNEESVDAAHRLLKKPNSQRQQILSLIAKGEATSTKQAERMLRQKTHADFNDPLSATLGGFSVGDWVEVSAEAENFETYMGLKGQVEQIWPVEQQISINFDGGPLKIKFYPQELTMIAKATPPNPFPVNDLVFIGIDRHEAVSSQEKKWDGYWGKVTQIGEMGSVTVDVGKESLQLFPRDLKPFDAPNTDLRDVVERVLRLRGFELDEIEERMLDVLQRREWFTSKQMIHLKNIEMLYLQTLYAHDDPLGE